MRNRPATRGKLIAAAACVRCIALTFWRLAPLPFQETAAAAILRAGVARFRSFSWRGRGAILGRVRARGTQRVTETIVVTALAFLVLAAPARAEFGFITTWGSTGSADGQLDNPLCVATDSGGNVYVADFLNDRIAKFDSNGGFVSNLGATGAGDGQFDGPRCVATDSLGNLYVAESGNDRVQKFDANGNFVVKWGSLGTTPGLFDNPQGIATDAAGNVYVSDSGNDRIQKFTSNGVFLTEWGTTGAMPGQLDNPRGVATDAAGNVYVADANNDRIQKFTSDGSALTAWGANGSAPGQFSNPRGVATDPAGDVWVADSINDRIQRFDANGTFIATFGSEGTGQGQFNVTEGIATDCRGSVYVSDRDNDRVQKFGEPTDPSPPCNPGLVLEVEAKAKQKPGKLAVTVSCPIEPCQVGVDGTAKARGAKANLKEVETALQPGQQVTLRLLARKKKVEALKEALEEHKGKAKIDVAGLDTHEGDTTAQQLKLKLKG